METKILNKSQIPGMVLPTLARWVCDESAILADEESPFHAKVTDGDDRLLLITGDNASGKSLAFRLISQIASDHKIHSITLSIRERTGGGLAEMGSLRRTMIYGDEHTSSTGSISARVVQNGFKNLNGKGPAILCLDEPEIGLSDGYARALGEYIGQSTREMPEEACGIIVVTHSRSLIAGLQKGLQAIPTHMPVGISSEPLPEDLQAWMDVAEHRSVEDFLALKENALARFRQVNSILKR